MVKITKYSFNQILAFFLLYLSLLEVKGQICEFNDTIIGNINYATVSFYSDEETINHFFKYSVNDIPKSRIGSFRFDFNTFNDLSQNNEVYCTFVDGSMSDEDLENELLTLSHENSTCLGKFNKLSSEGKFDGLIEYDTNKTKLGIILKAIGKIKFSATVYLQTSEYFLEAEENKVTMEEEYSLIPFIVNISSFRDFASKILFYSYDKELQMYYMDKDTPYPEKLFSGNVMSVYTNPNLVHQKYHDAKYMVLLTRDFSEEITSSEFKFQVKLFPSNYPLDYYVSNNPDGRSKNSPLSINMTDCENPYYIILNYNKPEKETSLYIDQIYGKIKSLSVAPTFSSITLDEMIEKDMQNIDVTYRKFVLPKESATHIDVYKLECEIPLLLNFYYVDETVDIPDLDYGQITIKILKPYEILFIPFASNISQPELTIEIFHPLNSPLLYVYDGENEAIISINDLIRNIPFSKASQIIIKERGGESNTRIIIKVGYNIYNKENWEKETNSNLYYNSELNMHVFAFPNDKKKLNYTDVNLIARGVKEGDNVKYCYGTNIGSAIIPSKENCYRVSKYYNYILKFLNPFVMHKEYDVDEDLVYYVSIKPVVLTEKMEIIPELNTYSTNERNIERI